MTRRLFFVALFVLLLLVGEFTHGQTGAAAPNIDSLGPRVGARAPNFSGVDQFGRSQTLQSVLGPEGAMLVFFRSADW